MKMTLTMFEQKPGMCVKHGRFVMQYALFVLLVMSAPGTVVAGDSVAPDNKTASSESIVEGIGRYRQAAEQGDADAQEVLKRLEE